jgi:predicted DCC family thiol-disulfide oxidoreductase YuxK
MFIRIVVKLNRNSNLYITDFHSAWTKENIKINPTVDSVLFVSNGTIYSYSDSVLQLFPAMNALFKPILLLKFVPKAWRDILYKLVARNRKALMQSQSCPIPTEKFRRMYLT